MYKVSLYKGRTKNIFSNVIVRGLTGPPSFRGTGFWVRMLPDKDITKRACLWHEKPCQSNKINRSHQKKRNTNQKVNCYWVSGFPQWTAMHCFRFSPNICNGENAATFSLNFPYVALSSTTDPEECQEIYIMDRIRSTIPAEAAAAVEAVGSGAVCCLGKERPYRWDPVPLCCCLLGWLKPAFLSVALLPRRAYQTCC